MAVDLASGGVSAALIDSDLEALWHHEMTWDFVGGRGTLSADVVVENTLEAIHAVVEAAGPADAIVLSSMMHTLLVTDPEGTPTSPVFTWLEGAGSRLQEEIRRLLGADYHERTGAHAHPAFPAFKLARLVKQRPDRFRDPGRIASAKAYLQAMLTGNWAEDVSTGAASGLLNVRSGDWDPATLEAIGIDRAWLPGLTGLTNIAGGLLPAPAGRLGLPAGTPVVAGGSDGLLAGLAGGCEVSGALAVTLGTTGAVRRFLDTPVLDPGRGTFCYRFRPDGYLFGCASSNGGNALDWARRRLAPDCEACEDGDQVPAGPEPPVFLPFLNGARSPFWDSGRRPRWVGIRSHHTPADLVQSVMEGVAFELAVYCGLVGGGHSRAVLSGNGFRTPRLPRLLATASERELALPPGAGSATLLGAARCGFEALGVSTMAAVERIQDAAERVRPIEDTSISRRFELFKESYFR